MRFKEGYQRDNNKYGIEEVAIARKSLVRFRNIGAGMGLGLGLAKPKKKMKRNRKVKSLFICIFRPVPPPKTDRHIYNRPLRKASSTGNLKVPKWLSIFILMVFGKKDPSPLSFGLFDQQQR